jgi:hypothetical protein
LKWTRVDDTREGSAKCGASEAQVTERLKERDEGAFLELYDWHGPQVYRFLVHMTGSIAVAEDLTQEVFAIDAGTPAEAEGHSRRPGRQRAARRARPGPPNSSGSQPHNTL